MVEIVDGDTIYLSDLDERLRLVGIDTPETRHPNRGVECYGREASSRLAELIPPGTRVRVEWDVERHDHYGRPLGYLYRADDELFVNERMLHDGYAQISTIPPNVAYQDQFLAAQRDAREAGRGLWSACGEDDGATAAAEPEPDDVGTSTGGVVISALEYDGPGWDVERGDSENVTLRNTSGTSVDVGQWSVSDSSGHIITIPAGYVIDSGSTLTIYSGPGGNTGAAYFAGRGQAIWNNSGGDTATLRDVGGGVIDTYSYDS